MKKFIFAGLLSLLFPHKVAAQPFQMGQGECPGVFAKAVGVNGKRGAIINFSKTDPEGWAQDHHPVTKSPADLVIYEMHHRDFSINRPDAKYPGKFLALTEPWAISHLKELGVNAVHILPSYDSPLTTTVRWMRHASATINTTGAMTP